MKIENFIHIIYCLLLSFTLLAIFSYTTSPFYFEPSSGDSAVYQIVGKYWNKDYIPYVDLWDQKGPIIHFVNCIGYLLTNSATGIFIIQWICLSITLILMYRLLRSGFCRISSCFLLLLPAISFAANTWGGNCVEEYVLPLMALSYLFIYKWLNDVEMNNSTTHPWQFALVYGLTFSFCLLTRLTNALGLSSAIAVIAIFLMVKKEWKCFGINVLSFLVGIALLLVPFMLYFWSKGALYDMWYGTILYNLDYAAASGNDATTINGVLQLFVHFLDTWGLLLVVVLALIFNHKRRLAGLIWTLVAIFSLAWFVRGNAFSHYGVVSLPLIAITLLEAKNIIGSFSENTIRRTSKRLAIAGLSVYFIITLASCWHTFRASKSSYIPNHELAETRAFMKDVPQSFRDSFVGYNSEIDYYLYDNIRPACRFFALQDYQANQSPSYQKFLTENFQKNKAQWILVHGKAKFIEPLLIKNYHIYKQDKGKGLTLYRKNQYSNIEI